MVAAWFGMVSGLMEAATISTIQLIPELLTWRLRLTGVSAQIFWIAPIFNTILFVLLGLIVVIFWKLVNRIYLIERISLDSILVFLFASLSFYDLMLIPDRLSRKAALILAIGLALQLALFYAYRRKTLAPLLRKSFFPLLFAVILAFGVTRYGVRLLENSKINNLPEAKVGSPNVLLIVLDTLRSDHLSSYGYQNNKTTNIDQIAEEGVLFENAIAASSWTPPSHASIFTGRSVNEHGVDGINPYMDSHYPTLSELFYQNGYVTGGFSANTLWINKNSGFDRGFIHFEDFFHNVDDMVSRTIYGKEIVLRIRSYLGYRDIFGRKRAADINKDLLSWLEGINGRPYFVFLNYFDMHTPYISPAPYHTQFMSEEQIDQERDEKFDPDAIYNGPDNIPSLWISGYDGALAYLDTEIGVLINNLDKRGLLDNTIIILTSDHGEAFGEHELYEHGHTLYQELINVPLIIRYPENIPAGKRVKDPVSIRQIPTTLESILFKEKDDVFPGVSLENYWLQEKSEGVAEEIHINSELVARRWLPKELPVSQGWIKSFVTPNWHFIFYESGVVELFDLNKDRAETENLAGTPNGEMILAEFEDKWGEFIDAKHNN